MPSSRICPRPLPCSTRAAPVLGLVELADGRVDADLAEEVRHAEGARLVGDDRHDALAERASLQQRPTMRTKATVVDMSLPSASSANFANAVASGVASGSRCDVRAGR
jgi:hypothetical protein